MVLNSTDIEVTKDNSNNNNNNLDLLCKTWQENKDEISAQIALNARPSTLLVWVLGLSVVTFITLSAVVGIALMRFVKKSTYSRFITFFVAVGVGSLSGSAVFHLLPQAYGLVNEFDPNASHDYLPKALTAVCGIYLFFIADKLIKIVLETRKANSAQFDTFLILTFFEIT
uniref:Zinc transporter n=1 Tax=Panagrolaimus sp. PS1159 TaxID=55785 RepID=A0AC35GTW1_9BILA